MSGTRMHVDTIGSGPPVLLLHGAGVAGWMWRPLLGRIGSEITAIVPDLPGFGRSRREPYVSHRATVAALEELVRDAAPGGLPVVGFSLGAQLAIKLASEHGDLVSGVGVVRAEALPTPMPRVTMALMSATAPLARREWFARAQARQLGIPDELTPDFVRESAGTSRETLLASVGENIRFTLPESWHDVPAPVFVMAGGRERRLMRDSARLISEQVPGAALRIVEASAHDIPFTAPDALAALMRATFGLAMM